MSSLVTSHLMNGVMDCIQVSSFRTFCKVKFAFGCAVLSFYTHLQVLLGGIGYNLTQKLCKLSSVLSLFVSCLLPVQTDLRIALSVSDTCHRQVHTNLFALALIVCS